MAAAVGVALLVGSGGDRATAGATPTMLVIGDSISANYLDEPGSPLQAWWSLVADELGYEPTVLAEAGSGYQRPGAGCRGSSFPNRPGVFAQPPPTVIVVEGGRNDWARCDGLDLVPVPSGDVLVAADTFLRTLTETYPDARIVVLAPPWGPLQQQYVDRVTEAVETAAERNGCEFVRMDGVLTAGRTPDGVHPDVNGSRAIAEKVLTALQQP
ncbi:SGNH/GDSL hydrolase family protein [Aeromicrobium sp. Leaf350]|uniref:SGNH/GDSL hydrolase family protein n=1 Tax=Aeromicrobium sp. Leaf350 TaxID=2876565 RepID=UPI001E2CC995|nr:SGNH/GDSL hydrolase family protein [Aeromicrobium sp. Leaf350]